MQTKDMMSTNNRRNNLEQKLPCYRITSTNTMKLHPEAKHKDSTPLAKIYIIQPTDAPYCYSSCMYIIDATLRKP